jgi:hypothetical protein
MIGVQLHKNKHMNQLHIHELILLLRPKSIICDSLKEFKMSGILCMNIFDIIFTFSFDTFSVYTTPWKYP